MKDKINIAILASGSGTNAENLALYFKDHQSITITSIWSNKTDAFVLNRAVKLGVPGHTFTSSQLKGGDLQHQLENSEIDYVILAGFLLKMPTDIVTAFEDKIINIHPALLPNYGGKGMYGHFVHEAVIQNKDTISGITIHLVNENYDQGRILFQASCPVNAEDTPDLLAARIHQLEHQYFPKVVEDYIMDKEADIDKNG